MKFRSWKFALLVGAIIGVAALIGTNRRDYIVSWIVAVTVTSLLGFYVTELVLFFVRHSAREKQKPAEPVVAPGTRPEPPAPAQPGLSRAHPRFIFW
jgi:phosphate/sulfate permease